jgi:hypothetical protein
MRILFAAVFLATLFGAAMPPALADGSATGPTLLEDFTVQPETRWRFFTDQVMGGVSTGGIGFVRDDGSSCARITGRVSTANPGGFIQMRPDLDNPPPEGTTGVRIDRARQYPALLCSPAHGGQVATLEIRSGRVRGFGKAGKDEVPRYISFCIGVGRDQQI